MRIIDRFDKYMIYKKINDNQVTVNCGLSVGLLGKARRGDCDLGKKAVEKILNFYTDLNRVWLLTGEGSMLKTEENDLLPAVNPFVGLGKSDGLQTLLPVYDATTSIDAMSLFNGNLKVKDYIYIPNLPKCDGAMLVHGDQMSPELRPGSIVVYKRVKDIENIWFGQMYIVAFDYRDDQHIVVKYVHESEKNEYIKLVSVNQKYPPVEIPTDSIKALAEIKASVRYNLWV